MRKWGAFAAIGAVMLVLVVYVKLFEDPIERHEEVSSDSIAEIATAILGGAPAEGDWTGTGRFGIDDSVLSEEAEDAIGAAIEPERFPAHFTPIVGELRQALEGGMDKASDDPARSVTVSIAQIRALAVSDDPSEASSLASALLSDSSETVNTANTLDQWMMAQASRLMVIEGITASIENDGWDDEALQLFVEANIVGNHREALSRVLHLRFVRDVQTKIVEASTESIISRIAASGLYEEPTDEEIARIGVLLFRHTRAFSPDDTAKSGAESLKQLKTAMQGPWAESQKVLDTVAGVQQIWLEYLEVMQMSDTDATAVITDRKPKFDKLENPVGIALLHTERTSWSSLVQSAYVADAKEAQFMTKLLRLAGREEEAKKVVDPMTGEPYDFDSGDPTSDLSGIGDDYGFIKAYSEE